MGRIYIVGNKDIATHLRQQECLEHKLPDNDLHSDRSIHDFMVSCIGSDVDVLILDADYNRSLCLRLAKHVRLSVEALGSGALCSIIFVSELSDKSFMLPHNYNDDVDVLSSEGVYVTTLSKLPVILPLCKKLRIENYKKGFLDRIHVEAPDSLGGHDLANQWGASVMYRLACGGEIEKAEYPELEIIKKDLYMKYVTVSTKDLQSLIFSAKVVGYASERTVNAEGKRILLIDDRAGKGWEDTLKNIFINYDVFDVISQEITEFEDYTYENQQKILFGEYDLYLLDLRLGGGKEENIFKTEDFSGMKVLKKIKSVNKGRQVIMFTASNKAWNFKALLNPDAGANGYYIKESPFLKLPEYFSERNLESFICDVTRCFDRGYLKNYHQFIQQISKDIEQLQLINPESPYLQMLQEMHMQMEIAFNLADIASSPNMYKYAYIAAEQVLEILSSHLTEVNETEKVMRVGVVGNRESSKSKTRSGYLYKLNNKEDKKERFSQFDRISAIYLQLCKVQDKGLMHLTRQIIQIRNSFIHPANLQDGNTNIDTTSLYYRSEICDSNSLYASEEYLPMFEDFAKKGLLYDNNGMISITMNVVDYQIGIELVLKVILNIYAAISESILNNSNIQG